MKNNKTPWKAWLIKKLLTNESTKEDILKILSENNLEDNENVIDNYDEINEKNLITNILALGKKSVEDIMVPRGEIIAIEENLNIENILSLVEIEAHSRMPVYRKNLDNILGFIHIKDILKTTKNKNFKINSMLREILYVAPKSPILELLKRMRSSRIHMSLVVDEFGGVDGLVTIEDLVEEIVGEIEDEHDAEDNEIKIEKLSTTKIVVDSSYKIIELEKYFDLKILEAKEIDTVGGFVFFLANKIPKKNESFKYKNKLNFKVLKASDRRIETLEIDKL